MTTPPEVLSAMCSAAAAYNGLRHLSDKQASAIYADQVGRMLAAAEALGWRLVQTEIDEAMIEDLAIKLYEERAKHHSLPMTEWAHAPDLIRELERRDAAAAHRLVLAAAARVRP